MPVLAAIGSQDEYVSGSGCQLSRKLAGSKSIIIADAGHDITGHPELKQAVMTFLRACCH